MRRWLVAVAVVSGLLIAAAEWGRADDVLTRVVVCTTTRAHLITANPNRIGGLVVNVGTLHVNVGRGDQMLTLHVGTALEITPGYTGGLSCQTQAGTGSTAVEIYEESR